MATSDEDRTGLTQDIELKYNKVPINNKIKSENTKLKKNRVKNLEFDLIYTDSSQSNDCEQNFLLLKEPNEKIKLIERAIGYFNADKDEMNRKNTLNCTVEGGPPFACLICNTWFYLGAKLKVHYILNHNLQHCEICSLLFEDGTEKTTHLNKYHSPVFCEICQEIFPDLTGVLQHYECVHDSTTCKFCGLLVQPRDLLPEHLEKKHQIVENFNFNDKFIEMRENGVDFYCFLCRKCREIDVLFGHMNSYHKLSLTALLNLLKQTPTDIKCNGTAKSIIQCEKNENANSKNNCTSCNLKYTKKIPPEFHHVYCLDKKPCKYCEKLFTSVASREKHLTKVHCKFLCRQGCVKLAYNSEENLLKHYAKLHRTVPCKYCEMYVPSDNYEDHLEKMHKFKAILLRKRDDVTLFERMGNGERVWVVCCLCDENITLLTGQVKSLFLHYEKIHTMSTKRIIQLCTARPVLPTVNFIYPQSSLNETPSTSSNFASPQLPTYNLPSSHSSSKNLSSLQLPTTNLPSPLPSSKEPTKNNILNESSSPSLSPNPVSTSPASPSTEPIFPTIPIKSEARDPETSGGENSDDTFFFETESKSDFSHLESEIKTDFDLDETEAFLNSEYETDDEREQNNCELCAQNFNTIFELLKHLNDKHNLKIKYDKLECIFCNQHQLNPKMYQLHLMRLHSNEIIPPTNSTRCKLCNMNVVTSVLRLHVVECHEKQMDLFNLLECGLKCRFCETKFWKKTTLNQHEKEIHFDGNKNYFHLCFVCNDSFSSQKCLKTHVSVAHPTENQFNSFFYKCTGCQKTYPTINLIRHHFQATHPNLKVYKCPVTNCDKTTKRLKIIQKHLKSPHSFKPLKKALSKTCDVCNKEFKTVRAASIHKLMKHERTKYAGFQCRICHEKFQTTEQRKLHYSAAHPGQLAYTCLECGKGFVSKSGLYGHKKIHQEHEIMTCPYCNKEFTRRDSYNEHLLIHIGPRHQCPHCTKSFTQRSNLTRHVRIHTGSKPYQCTFCEKRFSDKGACRSHERVHTKEEHCECSYCGKKFTKKQKLKYHIKFHTGEGLVNCEVCNKQFSNTYSLSEHRRIHNQETLVMCNCGRGFTSEKYLQRHILNVHTTNPAKYICPICYKPLLHKSSYNDHIMTHTSVKHVKCLLCNQEYNTKKTVKRHLLEKHNIEVTGTDLNKYIYQLKPEDVGLNVPSASEMEINVNELLTDKNLVTIDMAQLEKLETFKNKPKITKTTRQIQEILIKKEPTSEDDDENNVSSDENLEEAPLESRKRKIRKPIRIKRKSLENQQETCT